MTRTERNSYPAALLKDRHSRSGLHQPSESQRKQGAGAHNWGSYKQEGEFEFLADADARQETEDAVFDVEGDDLGPLPGPKPRQEQDEGGQNEDVVNNKDLARDVIATSPSESMASLDSAGGQMGPGGRRMSNVSEEEREKARVYREGIMNRKNSGNIDLAHIARTSYGIAQSPPNASVLATSPTKVKNGFNFKQ